MRSSQTLVPGQTFDAQTLLAPFQALLVFRAQTRLRAPAREEVALENAQGRVLASDACARGAFPACARSTMDGFAVRSSDGERDRRISGEVRMGESPLRGLDANEALRIPTGGALPEGADAVVPLEDVDESHGRITLRTPPEAGDYVTQAGDDMRPGDVVLRAGRRLDGVALGVLATLGIARPTVYRKPRIAIFSTGDELVDPLATPSAAQVRDSNRYAVAGAIAALGCEALHYPRISDHAGALEAALRSALGEVDAIILTGGSSVGARDHTPQAIARLGEPGVIVHGLRVKPGKPTVLAAIGDIAIFGLPGNPTSALMILRTVVAPLLLEMTGEIPRPRVPALARVTRTIEGRVGWTWFVPVAVRREGLEVTIEPLVLRSAHTSLLAKADGFVILPEDRGRFEIGESVEVHAFDSGEM